MYLSPRPTQSQFDYLISTVQENCHCKTDARTLICVSRDSTRLTPSTPILRVVLKMRSYDGTFNTRSFHHGELDVTATQFEMKSISQSSDG